ncbi:hypothetical protein GQR58_004512 [Nymphon striatum]|nr:hypothetical protein GQR58_004512 [Nymphon striatum]
MCLFFSRLLTIKFSIKFNKMRFDKIPKTIFFIFILIDIIMAEIIEDDNLHRINRKISLLNMEDHANLYKAATMEHEKLQHEDSIKSAAKYQKEVMKFINILCGFRLNVEPSELVIQTSGNLSYRIVHQQGIVDHCVIFENCHGIGRERYRRLDGSCNNMQHQSLGKADAPFLKVASTTL